MSNKIRIYYSDIADEIINLTDDIADIAYGDEYLDRVGMMNGCIGKAISKKRSQDNHTLVMHRTPFKTMPTPTKEEYAEAWEEFRVNGGAIDSYPASLSHTKRSALVFLQVLFVYCWHGENGLTFEWNDTAPDYSTVTERYHEEETL